MIISNVSILRILTNKKLKASIPIFINKLVGIVPDFKAAFAHLSCYGMN